MPGTLPASIMMRGLPNLVLAGCLCVAAGAAFAQAAARPVPLKSGIEFTSAELRSLQDDEFANPAMLWVTRGSALWQRRHLRPAGGLRA